MWEHSLLAAGDEHGRVLQTLCVVHRHQRHEPLIVAARVGVCHQGDLLQEDFERVLAIGGRRVELAAHLDELLEVLDPALGLDRALGLERLHIARLRQHRFEQPRDRARRGGAIATTEQSIANRARALRRRLHTCDRAQLLHRVHEAPQRLHRGRAEAGDLLGLRGGIPDGLAERLGVADDARERRLPDAPSR